MVPKLLSLNAPSGAQCFPTSLWGLCSGLVRVRCLNAPSGAQCFPTVLNAVGGSASLVSMHLLVLSAFRLRKRAHLATPNAVSMHLLVLSAFRLRPQKTAPHRRLPERNRRRPGKHHIESARTCPIKPHNREKPPQNTQRRRRPLPASTPPASNEPKPKTDTSRLRSGRHRNQGHRRLPPAQTRRTASR